MKIYVYRQLKRGNIHRQVALVISRGLLSDPFGMNGYMTEVDVTLEDALRRAKDDTVRGEIRAAVATFLLQEKP